METVHILCHGTALCSFQSERVPGEWPLGHKWVGLDGLSDASCESCLRSALEAMTYVLEHNPNCPAPYLIRLPGRGMGIIDKQPLGESRDIFIYGENFPEVARKALLIPR